MKTPLGPLTLVSTSNGLAAVRFGAAKPDVKCIADENANRTFIRQIEEYFEGDREQFDLPLDVQGTPFQMSVWRELQRIPYGETRSYGEIAANIGRPGAARAVGMANHDNPVAVIIPCHRVIGRNGSLTGYAGGLQLKQKLLALEQRTPLFT
jgi:methylated-DNA-[protein]-cysteine S-methyltransferase